MRGSRKPKIRLGYSPPTSFNLTSPHCTTTRHTRPFSTSPSPLQASPVAKQTQGQSNSDGFIEKNVVSSTELPPWDWQRMISSRQRRAAIRESSASLIPDTQKLISSTVEYFTNLGSTQHRKNTYQPHHGLSRPPPPEHLTLSALVASGAHIGHFKSLMFPTFIPYAYGTRAGVTIIDLEQTLPMLRRAANVVRAIAQNNGMILFVGTSPALRPIVAKAAERLGSENGFHVGERWLPGTLTNRIGLFGSEAVKTKKLKPDCVIFLNPLNNLHAIRECAIEHIPTIGITDSNADPRIVMYSIPANDESVRTAELVAGVLSLAGQQASCSPSLVQDISSLLFFFV